MIDNKKDNLKLWYKFNNDTNIQPIINYPILECDKTNLKAWYKFDDNYNDEISGNNIIPSINSEFSYDSIVNKSVYIPNGEIITIPFSACSSLFSGIKSGNTLTFWFKISSSITNLLGALRTGTTYDRYMIQNYSTAIYWTRQDNRVSNYAGLDVNFQKPSNLFDIWHHIALVGDWDGTNITSKIYLDGIEQTLTILTGTQSWSDPPDFLENATIMLGGNIHPTNGTNYYEGYKYFDDLRIYDKALNEYEINQLYIKKNNFDNGIIYNYAKSTSPYLDGILKNSFSKNVYSELECDKTNLKAHYKFDNNLIDTTGNTILEPILSTYTDTFVRSGRNKSSN